VLSIALQPCSVADQPDPSSFAMYPILCSSSAMGCIVAAMLRLGLIASDRKSDNIAYVIGSPFSTMAEDESRLGRY
jgi:hypothetical protein